MQAAVSLFIGEHDFRNFAAPLPEGKSSSVRAVHDASVLQSGSIIEIWVTGNAFLQHQVRRMAGALVDVGKGRLSASDLQAMIENRETDKVANSLPAHGLCLISVEYADYPPEPDSRNIRH